MIALGGKPPIDLAKAVALLTSHGGRLAYNVKAGGSAKIGKVSPVFIQRRPVPAPKSRAFMMGLLDSGKIVAVNLSAVADLAVRSRN